MPARLCIGAPHFRDKCNNAPRPSRAWTRPSTEPLFFHPLSNGIHDIQRKKKQKFLSLSFFIFFFTRFVPFLYSIVELTFLWQRCLMCVKVLHMQVIWEGVAGGTFADDPHVGPLSHTSPSTHTHSLTLTFPSIFTLLTRILCISASVTGLPLSSVTVFFFRWFVFVSHSLSGVSSPFRSLLLLDSSLFLCLPLFSHTHTRRLEYPAS